MTNRVCHNKDVTVCEEVFGEIFGESTVSSNDVSKTETFSGVGEGDCCCSCGDSKPIEPVKIKSYTLRNDNKMTVKIITWGATIVSIKTPDKYGKSVDVVLGFDDMKNYLDPNLNQFMGCVLGRCANRIKNGRFRIKNDEYELSKNDGDKHHLHGGTEGFGRQVWEAYVDDDCSVVMSYLSEDGEEGYPGAVLTTVKFELTRDNRLIISMRATTSKPTIVNLSHGSLFNLAGHDAGDEELKAHRVTLNCDRWTFSEYNDPIPTGAIRGVGGTVMDLRVPKLLRDVMENVPSGEGFDHNFCVVKNSKPEVNYVCRVLHAKSGRYLEVYSDQPGVQFYTGGRLPPYAIFNIEKRKNPSNDEEEAEEEGEEVECEGTGLGSSLGYSDACFAKILEFLPGKCGAMYRKFGAFSVQPQNYPNAVNIEHFPCTLLRPGQVYSHDLVYKFGIQLGGYM